MSVPHSNPAIAAAESRRRAFLSERRFRKARDEFKQLGKQDHARYLPLLIEAMGAAVQAGIIAGQTQHSVLVDITPHSYATSSLARDEDVPGDLVSVPIIRRNTPLPASKSELFYTVVDRQASVRVDAHQGEDLIPTNNLPIGEFLVEGLSPVPAGNPVIIHFDLDLNGILKVTATEKATGMAKTVTMDTRGRQVLNMEEARRNIASLIGEKEESRDGAEANSIDAADDSDPGELLASAKDLKRRSQAFIAAHPNHEYNLEIKRLMHESAEAISNQIWTVLEECNNALMDLLFYLED